MSLHCPFQVSEYLSCTLYMCVHFREVNGGSQGMTPGNYWHAVWS